MNKALLTLNIILLVAVGFLFYKYYSTAPHSFTLGKTLSREASAAAAGTCRIAYFEMDSVDNNCDMVKDVKNELSKQEEANNTEIMHMDQQLRERIGEYQKQAQASGMTAAQNERANQDIEQRRQQIQRHKIDLDQAYQTMYMRLNTDMKKKIEVFLNEYNKNNTYSYIFAYESGLFFYKDSALNITRDVVNGLNEMYKKQKKQ